MSAAHIKRLLPLLLLLLLSGCNWNQKQQFAACALEAGRQTSREDSRPYFPPPGFDYVEACMRAHGYEVNQDRCFTVRDDVIRPDPAVIAAMGEKLGREYTEDIEKRVAALAAWRKGEPSCYEPTGWFGKQVLQIEKRIEKWLRKSKEDAQIELIECAGFQSALLYQDLPIYEELKRIGTQPVDIQAIPGLASSYANTYTVTKGRGAEVKARWDEGVAAGNKLVEKRDTRRIAKYLKSCVGTLNDALQD